MTTFSTLSQFKSSLIIDEKQPSSDDFTKSICMKFDNKSEYRISSYRIAEIAKHNKDNRIILANI